MKKRVFTPKQHAARLEASRRWRSRNPGKMRTLKLAAYKRAHPIPRAPADPEAPRRAKRAYKARYPEKRAADKNARRAREAAVSWANRFFIAEAYALARLRTRVTGYQWHVDHIVPLRSPLVCGLHTHGNLRVIPALENVRKGNRLISAASSSGPSPGP